MKSLAFEARYSALNARQKEAVDAIEGPVLVIAGPGSGKTELLALRVANILRKTDASPGNILCLTFTDSAAANMRKRLFDLIGEASFRVAIHTFHGFATRMIERYPHFFFEGAQFHSADDVVQIETLRKVFESLPHDHVLRSFHPEQGFVFLRDVKSRIGDLKRAGMSPSDFRKLLDRNEKEFDEIETVLEPLFGRVSKKEFVTYQEIVAKLKKKSPEPHSLFGRVSRSLASALREAEELDSTTPLSDWKRSWIKKDDDGRSIWRDRAYADKLRGACDIFERYEKGLYEEGYFDFGDMIMGFIDKLESHASLRAELEETFQYVLVDEFQDTNGAQMKLVELLTSSPVHEGRPNVMAVGDDDQAVYKFQGAELDNILAFRDMYKDPKVIVLEDNYRSTRSILDIAEHVVGFNADRLTNVMPSITKKLAAANRELPAGAIRKAILPTPLHQMKFVSDEVKRLIGEGVSPDDIAIISREHSELKMIVPFLHERGIPVSYERQRNVLHEEHVRELVTIARYVHARAGVDAFSLDSLLPEILRYPFWGVAETDIWRLARFARDERISWTEALGRVEDDRLRAIGNFLGSLALRSHSETAEFVLDNLVGTLSVSIDDGEGDKPSRLEFKSPFRAFYWSDERLRDHKAEYLAFLSSLRTFIAALREHKSGTPLTLSDLIAFVDLREKNNVPLLDNSPFAQAMKSVSLLTAHKAKGQEFGTVFILSCQDDMWASSSSRNKLPFPINLPITPSSDALGDFVRLFFVAVTRARHTLYLMGYEMEESGKQSLPLRFLAATEKAFAGVEDVTPKDIGHVETLELASRHASVIPRVRDERALFDPILADYRMSVTHLANFLDVARGGPRYFFEQNLLYFPQAKTPSGSFGTAVHETLKRVQLHLKTTGSIPSSTEVHEWFALLLRSERLSAADERHYFSKGVAALNAYLKERKGEFRASDEVEVNFKHEGVCVGDARIEGKIDRLSFEGGGVVVTDYKTGGALADWEPKDTYDKAKAARYRRQLLFYKLLVEGSARFKGKEMARGVIDFVEPEDGRIVSLDATFSGEEVERLSLLIQAVFKKIQALDFPDVSIYGEDENEIARFEDDLISGAI
ncbi:MAG: ATP-dependent DNA helicase [Candidatus Paceibacterota bacterium]|jgi:DNA helicase-2/ATP-dependent DNA helicase PcrA